ncbi:MAG: T9SS type A sorting domain-containing protein [Paludibacter sp.]|nr:T9SS type A sorting domain-containing protein [Paludibacter sp.]
MNFHVHTVTSNGKVWSDVPVDEAYQQGLDAIVKTDYLDYRLRKEIFNVDGKIIKSIIPSSNKLDVSDLPKSMYLIKAFKNQQVESATFIKE